LKTLTVVIGNGGHSTVVTDALAKNGINIDFIFDNDPKKQNMLSKNGHVIEKLPLDEWWRNHKTKSIIAIGSNPIRKKLSIELNNTEWIQSIHPSALIHESAIIGKGVYIGANVVIQPNAVIGDHAIVNTAAIIEHDCFISHYCHIAPGAILAGHVYVDEGAFIAAGAVVIPQKNIGKWAMIGAGSVVVKDIPAYQKAFGVPCKIVGLVEDR
jgi:acetyltransferase EpsM